MIRANIQLRRGEFSLDVDFETEAHVTGVFGPSGAGKTTLINTIAGLERPDGGMIAIEGETLFGSETRIDVPAHRRRVGVVFQEHRLFPHLSVRGNLAYGCPRGGDAGRSTAADHAAFRTIVDLLKLGPVLERRITELSGGERQRVAFGRALASRPRALLLDEPLASLDLRLKQQIIPYLQRIRDASNIPMLYVSHDLTEILQLTDRLLVLESGRVAGHGRLTDLAHIAAAFGVVHDRGLCNVLSATVEEHRAAGEGTIVRLGAGDSSRRLIVPACAAATGSRISIAINPWDIALATRSVEGVSIQNQLSGVVSRCTLHDSCAIVEVGIGEPVMVEVSRTSAASLCLAPGKPIVCLIKSHAISVIA